MRTFEFSEGTSNKFWRIALSGNRTTVTYGKIGTAGQTQIKVHADGAAAQKEHDKLVAEKLKKGYKETTTGSAAAPAAPAVAPPPAPAKPPQPSKAKPVASGAAPGDETVVRTFEYSDATSHKFWNVQRDDTRLTITYGRIGTEGQTQLKSFPDVTGALKERDKLVAEKLKKGYRETTPSAKKEPTSLRESLELALVENPDELANHMAYADYLSEQGDPLGDFIRVQLALEDPSKSPNDRKKLQAQEKKLLDANARAWLGELAPFLLGEKNPEEEEEEYEQLRVEYAFRRGWLDALKVEGTRLAFTRVLTRAPQVRLLRRLEITSTRSSDEEEPPQPGDGVPDSIPASAWAAEPDPALYPLTRSEHLGNVRTFILGELSGPDEEHEYVECGPSCHVAADGVVGVVKVMPRLEELRLPAHRVDAKQLFALPTLNNLRILQVDHCHDYPLERLAKNPSLGNLTHFLCYPHGLEGGDEAYVRAPGVKALVNSPHLKSLTHLRLRCSDMGDKGAREIARSGILKRLKMLDLRHGNVGDEGARALADAIAGTSLQFLDLSDNALTAAGSTVLKDTKVKLLAESQHDLVADDDDEKEYLWWGDPE